MALAILGRGSLQGLMASGYALTPRFSPHVVRGCKLPRPKRTRAILGSGGTQQFKVPASSSSNVPYFVSPLCLFFITAI